MQRDTHNDISLIEQMPEDIQKALLRFDELYFDSIESIAPTILKAVELLHRQKSKQIRPLLLMLTAKSFGRIDDQVVRGSIFIELLHVSTLVHDDVIDESLQRRGVASMNAVFDNRKAVLIGDYLLATAMVQAIETDNYHILTQLTRLGQVLSEGELIQMDTAELGDYSEQRYIDIIDRKTASLIESSMVIGALIAGVEDDSETMIGLRRAGRLLGRAFQIRDDIFDYAPTNELGKPAGQDIAEHKVTLPLIYALQQESKERDKVLKLLRHEELSRSEIRFITDFAHRMGGIEYATERMSAMVEEAKRLLMQVIPPSESREAILTVADYITTRER